jgi:hypothetical protein
MGGSARVEGAALLIRGGRDRVSAVASNKNAQPTGFRRWYAAGFMSELLPIIPPNAKLREGTTVRPEHRGKTPGVRNADNTWSGLSGKWSA